MLQTVDKPSSASSSEPDGMAQPLGETSDMPALSAESSPASRAAARVTQMLNEASESDGMSAAGEAAEPVNTYIGGDGREHPIDDVQATGMFYVKADDKITVFLTLLGAVVGGALVFIIWMSLWFISANIALYCGENVRLLIGIVLVVAAQPFIVYHMLTHIRGKLHSYKADGRGFYVTVKGGGSEQIFYKDVISVDYTPMKLFGGAHGYQVDIRTTYGVVHYDYIYPRFNHRVSRQYLPFEVIRKNMPNKGAEETY